MADLPTVDLSDFGLDREDYWKKYAAKKSGGASFNAPPPRSSWEVLTDSVHDMMSSAGNGLNAAFIRGNEAAREEDLARQFASDHNQSPNSAQLTIRQNQERRAAEIKERRASRALQMEDEQRRRSPVGRVAAKAAEIAGTVIGDINPTYAIGAGGVSALERILLMGGLAGANDIASQGDERLRGIRDRGDPLQTLETIAVGAAVQGVGEGVAHLVKGIAGNLKIRAGAKMPNYGDLLRTMMHLEGGGTIASPKISPKGAKGPAQVMDATARDPGFGIKPWDGKTESDRFRVGTQYLAALNHEFKGDSVKVLAAYNGGVNRVKHLITTHGDNWLDYMPHKTQNYVSKGLRKMGKETGPEDLGQPDIVAGEQPSVADQAHANDKLAELENLAPSPEIDEADMYEKGFVRSVVDNRWLPRDEAYEEAHQQWVDKNFPEDTVVHGYGHNIDEHGNYKDPQVVRAIEDQSSEIAQARHAKDYKDASDIVDTLYDKVHRVNRSVVDAERPLSADQIGAAEKTREQINSELRNYEPETPEHNKLLEIDDMLKESIAHSGGKPRTYGGDATEKFLTGEPKTDAANVNDNRFVGELPKEGLAPASLASDGKVHIGVGDGFVTKDGTYLTREQAKAYVKSHDMPESRNLVQLIKDLLGDEEGSLKGDNVTRLPKKAANDPKYPDEGQRGYKADSSVYHTRIVLNHIKSGHDLSPERWDQLARTLSDARKGLAYNRIDHQLTPAEQRAMHDIVDMLEEANNYNPHKTTEAPHVPAEEVKPSVRRSFIQAMKDMLNDDSGSLKGSGDAKGSDGEKPTPSIETNKRLVLDKLGDALEQSSPIRREAEAAMAKERARRLAAVYSVRGKKGGEAGFHSELAALKGSMGRPKIQSIRDWFTQPEIDLMYDIVNTSTALQGYDTVNAKMALKKLLGADYGEIPTAREVELLARAMPRQAKIWKQLLENEEGTLNLPDGAVKSAVINTLGLTRTLKASFDVSAPGRQGLFLIGSKEYWKALPGMFKSFVSEGKFHAIQEEIRGRDTFDLMNKAGLQITRNDATLGEREEAFISQFAEHIPGVRNSERAYLAFLNKLRADMFDDFVKKGEKLGIDFIQDPHYLKSAARFINSATGRGDLGSVAKNGQLLANILFSPKLMKSRIDLLNPLFYAGLHPKVRIQAAKHGLIYASMVMSMLGLAGAAGLKIEKDMRSSDFGKIQIGNTRFDVTGGLQPYVRFYAQFITGQQKGINDGLVRNLGWTIPQLRKLFPGVDQGAFKPTTRKDLLYKFFENKESPNASEITRLLQGTDAVGNPLTAAGEAENLFAPLIASDTYHAWKDLGAAGGLLSAAFTALGGGVQTYTPKKKKAPSVKASDFGSVGTVSLKDFQ